MTGTTIGSGMTLTAGYTITVADGNGFALTNNGVIGATGLGFGLVVQSSGDFVDNAGKILASTATGDAIFATHSVRITNRSGGLISASYGIQLSGGGTIVNASGGSITGRGPIYASGTSVYVGNQGAITGTGTSNTQGGVVLNAGGYVYNKPGGTISGANGVLEGVFAKVRNEGAITGNNADGVELNAGGTVTTETQTPNSAATISGSYAGIVVNGAPGYVLDGSGQISGGTGGVFLQAGGYIHQIGGPGGGAGGGTIAANYAVAINNGSGTVETGGRILGGALGVGMDGAGPHKVTLSSIGATISGAKAISISGGPGYIYDKGTINGGTSGTAVILPGGYNNVLEIYSGAKIYGQVNGGNFQAGPHTTTLLLAQGYSTGTLTGFGNRYNNMGNVTIKSGANWTMDGSNTFIDPSVVNAGSTTFLPVTLLDAGTLTFGGTEFGRLTLGSSAHLTVSKGGVLTPAYLSQAVYAPSLTTAPVVVTDGQITAAGNDGIRLDDGGTVTNQSDGTISAQFVGVRVQNAKGTVTNSGLIKSAITYGIALGAGGSVTNTGGTIMGTLGVGIYGGAGTVTNTGRIVGSGSDDGVQLKAGGTVINQAGTIIGLGGIFISGGAGTVTNYGQITGTGIYSVNLSPGFANRLRIAPGASFSGSFVDGGNTAGATAASTIELLSAAGAGTINGIGSQYKFFSDITVNSGATWTIGSSGAIAAYQTLVDSGTVINEVFVASEVTVANGTFINASGYLFGDAGVVGPSGTNVVVNNSNIRATQIGVSFATPGRVTNQSDGFIGGRIGVFMAQGPGASVVNQGLIEGYTAVYLLGGGSVDNQSGLISGRLGVVISGGNGTVRNAGTIVSVGDYGVIFPDHGADRLVLVPGSTIAGLVHGGLAGTGTSFSTLELASGGSAGSIGGIGSKYFNFVDLTVDSGAAWTFASGQTIAANQTLLDNGTLTNNATALTDIQLGSGAALTNASGGTVNAVVPVAAQSGFANAATVVNYGLLDGSGGDYGVELLSGGSVTNRAGTIKSRTGVAIDKAGTVTNTGSIVGSTGTAVSLFVGFQNQVAMSPGAVFTGTVDGGNVSASGTAISTLELMTGAGAGTLSGLGSKYVHFQNFVVDPGAIWTIAAGQQLPATYTLTDNGTLTNNAAALTGVTLGAGAYLDNAVGVTISSASDGALALGAGATVVNSGNMQGGSFGVSLVGPNAEVINHAGTISGGVFGATIGDGRGTVINYSVIVGGLAGVALSAGGAVLNGGQIAGLVLGGVGIVGGVGTVENYGTISGGNGTAVALATGFQNLVKVEPEAVFNGVVNGGNTIGAAQVSTLELARLYEVGLGNFTGTVSGLGGQYINFGQITVDAGASWAVTGNPTLAAGITLSNSGVLAISSDALNIAGSVYNNGLIQEIAGTFTAGRLLGTGEVVIGAGSTLMASGLVGYGQTIDFTGAGLLALTPGLFSGQIDGLRSGGTIELTGITDATLARIIDGNTLEVFQSAGPTIDLTLDPTQSYADATFSIATIGGAQFISASGQSGPTVIDQAETVNVAGPVASTMEAVAGGLGGIVVTGAGSLLNVTSGELFVGDTGLGSLAIEAGGTVTASGAAIANSASASGSSISMTGAGSSMRISGVLTVGGSGSGSLQISSGASATVGALDLAAAATGDGSVSVAGAGSVLTVIGALTLGDQAAGELSILGGAQMTIAGGVVGGTGAAAAGNLDIEGVGSQLTINGGTLVVGANGPAEFTLGVGATLSGEVATDLFGVTNEYGNVDPATDQNDGTMNVGLGNSSVYDFFVANSGTIKITSGTATFYTPLVTDETAATDGSVNGLWQIGAHDTLVMNATSVDNTQTFDLTSATGATLVIGQVPSADPSKPDDTFNGQTMPTLTASIAPGSPSVLAGWDAPIANYASGDVITLSGLTYGSATASGDVVTVWSGVGSGTVLGELTFVDKNDNPSSADAVLAAAQINALACFAAGTRIGTVDGLVAVERLRVGDLVVTVDGGCEPVVWVGSRAVDCARHPRPETVWPVRVRAGAFGVGAPARDVWLSPDHAVFVDGVLVPVKLLVNGGSIAAEKRQHVVYYHVELPEHAVILAEGLAVESYLDTGDRTDFDGGGTIRLYPDFGARLAADAAMTWETKGAAPLVMTGAGLETARAAIAANFPRHRDLRRTAFETG